MALKKRGDGLKQRRLQDEKQLSESIRRPYSDVCNLLISVSNSGQNRVEFTSHITPFRRVQQQAVVLSAQEPVGQDSGFGKRYYNVDFDRTDHAAVARAYGVRAWTVEDPAELQAALGEALAHDGPSLVDVISQPLHEAAAPVSEWVA